MTGSKREVAAKTVGGVIGLAEPSEAAASPPPFLLDGAVLLASARSGISIVARHVAPGCVWMPSYLCRSMLEAVSHAGARVELYAVDETLNSVDPDWPAEVAPGDLVVVIDYFGFAYDRTCIARVKKRGAWILEDASQALLSDRDGSAHFVLYSPHKFLGVPDGGILVAGRDANLPDLKLEPPPSSWWLDAFRARILRRDFDSRGGSREWLELFQHVEATSPNGAFAMSELTQLLLRRCFDYEAIRRQRVENYNVLSAGLREYAVFPTLGDGVCPLGFPMRTAKRDRVRRRLFSHEIYPPVHWALDGVVPRRFSASHRLSAEIMTLPCDQRYCARDMQRVIEQVSEALKAE
ncbi:MAG: DegT/DnrJ/EryC1/StrS aminotransferase family protein [Proteobacteria bacterium]|nr:DegT/DnrJ/EryC1/StrS aminotransferase family protein [Pseudomonadota bacterium]